jgi:hypothetical protein
MNAARRVLPLFLAIGALVVTSSASAASFNVVSGDPAHYSIGARDYSVGFYEKTTRRVGAAWVVPWCCGAWIGPIAGSQWVSASADSVARDAIYAKAFTLPEGATNASISLSMSSDNSAKVTLNGNTQALSACNDPHGTGAFLYVNTCSSTSALRAGANVLAFDVDNLESLYGPNPTGVDFVATVTYTPAPSHD